jgi:NADH:ubiquinone oxidoreductase subunit C
VSVDVPAAAWVAAVRFARDSLECGFFDFLSAVDELEGVRVVCHLARRSPFGHLLLRCLLPSETPAVGSVAEVYTGAAWHERETAEMFGVTFLSESGEPLVLEPLLLPPGFEGHPLRKDFLLQSRLDRPWPGAPEPGESTEEAAQKRRRLRPPGVPDDSPGGRRG